MNATLECSAVFRVTPNIPRLRFLLLSLRPIEPRTDTRSLIDMPDLAE